MRKRRSDSPWSKLTPQQHELMDQWFFDQGLSQQQILKEAAREFGIKASQQTLTRYFRHREKVRKAENVPGWTEADDLLLKRTNGMKLEEMETRAFYLSAAAAYELSQAAPNKMRVKELRSLMKMLSERRYAKANFWAKEERFEFQKQVALAKLELAASKVQTKEEAEKMMFDMADIFHRTKQKMAEQRAEREAERKRREEASSAAHEVRNQTKSGQEPSHGVGAAGGDHVVGEDAKQNVAAREGGSEEEVYNDI